jgi:hypothetical protein
VTVLTPRGQTSQVASRPSRARRADAAALGLLATRVSFACRRALQSVALTEEDRKVLREVAKQLADEAAAVRVVASSTREGTEPNRGAAAGLAVTALASDGEHLDDEGLAERISNLASALNDLARGDSSRSTYILHTFETIGALARAEAGSAGERLMGRD